MRASTEPNPIPDADLPGANWSDRHVVLIAEHGLTAMDAVQMVFQHGSPPWVRVLMRLRNQIVGLFGLKPADMAAGTSSAGGFPVVSETPSKVVLGFDDWHLDFRIVVETVARGDGTDVSLSTLVKRKNWFGRAYIFLITPFHVLIVKTLLNRLVRVSSPRLPA